MIERNGDYGVYINPDLVTFVYMEKPLCSAKRTIVCIAGDDAITSDLPFEHFAKDKKFIVGKQQGCGDDFVAINVNLITYCRAIPAKAQGAPGAYSDACVREDLTMVHFLKSNTIVMLEEKFDDFTKRLEEHKRRLNNDS